MSGMQARMQLSALLADAAADAALHEHRLTSRDAARDAAGCSRASKRDAIRIPLRDAVQHGQRTAGTGHPRGRGDREPATAEDPALPQLRGASVSRPNFPGQVFFSVDGWWAGSLELALVAIQAGGVFAVGEFHVGVHAPRADERDRSRVVLHPCPLPVWR